MPVHFVETGQDAWQADMGGGKWHDVDPTWTEPLFAALREAVATIRLSHTYKNRHGEEVRSWYTIDFTDAMSITQQNEATGKRRELRAVQLMKPTPVESVPPPAEVPPPTEQPAAAADPADAAMGGA